MFINKYKNIAKQCKKENNNKNAGQLVLFIKASASRYVICLKC